MIKLVHNIYIFIENIKGNVSMVSQLSQSAEDRKKIQMIYFYRKNIIENMHLSFLLYF